MADYTAAQDALKRATLLAADHHTALDSAVRLMNAHAWVGGGAQPFTEILTAHRARLRSSLAAALHALADLVVRHGGPAPAIPAMTGDVAAISATPGGFQGIDPRAMAGLLATLDQAGHTLAAAGSRLAADLSGQGLSAQPAQALGHIATWATDQTADLRRRLTRIRQTVPGPMLPAAITAYELFGAHAGEAPDLLLSQLLKRDTNALTRLLARQDTGLAARINAWWHTLGNDLQPRLLDMAGFGLLNGLPAAIRDQANRRWLATEKTRLTTALAAATKSFTHPLDIGGWEQVANQLRRIEFIEAQLQPRPGYPPPLLLGFDVTGQGRLIVSWGDPDTADITVTNVSGLTTRLETAAGDLAQARALWQQATKTSGAQTVASITWYGYDAPQIDPGLLSPSRSVASDDAAKRGGAALAAFQDGLHAAHEPSSTARAVVIGHSYGSLTTGQAATLRPGRFADDLILVGSPGVGVEHAAQLGLDPKHVWVGEAGGDPVAALGRFGTDPGHDSFGAQHFPVGRNIWTAAHSSYWDPASASLRNMGRLINGQYDDLEQPHHLDGAQLLMPELAPDLVDQLDR
ncbi:alpha/beta hydrolase family protein [Nonomuraea sp. NBC_01738]|uniref:alpha/beta hydrolase n=1 Tax=Nonomuraea sp. NBC_01738 TaxID=2976003 RepID=UPI002E0FC2FA|nr:alpha/beta hydrolase family protein [Nonomuraea sp. NBC_01738]